MFKEPNEERTVWEDRGEEDERETKQPCSSSNRHVDNMKSRKTCKQCI